MPMPVSVISKRNRPSAPERSASTDITTCPASVNLIAFPARLSSTCLMRPESPTTRRGASLA